MEAGEFFRKMAQMQKYEDVVDSPTKPEDLNGKQLGCTLTTLAFERHEF